jgi:thioredoxin 1
MKLFDSKEDGSYEDYIKNGKHVVMHSSSWCGPCKMLTPILDKISQEYPDITFSKVDIEQEQDLTTSLDIRGVPTIMMYDAGELKYKHIGASSAPVMKSYIDEHLS